MNVNEVAILDRFQSRDETVKLVHRTIANYGSCFAL